MKSLTLDRNDNPQNKENYEEEDNMKFHSSQCGSCKTQSPECFKNTPD